MIVQQKTMAGIMIRNFVISIGVVPMVHPKNLNVRVGLLGIIKPVVVIGLIVSIVHVQKKPQKKFHRKMKRKKIHLKSKMMMIPRLLLLVNPQRKILPIKECSIKMAKKLIVRITISA
jgi:hypothetical protein